MKYSKVKVCLKEQPVIVTITSDEKPKVSDLIVNKWQDIIDLIALTVNVSSALIMRLEEKHMCVFLESNTKGNSYNKGEKVELGSGFYCETVAGKKSCLLVPNALKDPLWKENPDIELNMISYLGFPIIWPDGEVFGTICVLDNKENHYNNKYIKLIEILKDSIEKDLQLIMEEQNLKQQKEEFEAILENMSDTLYTINKDYNVTYLNSAAREDIYECDSMKKVYNTYKYNEHYDSEGNFLTFKSLPEVRVLKGEKLKDYRYTSHRPDGIYHISFSGSPIYDNSGNIIKAIICSRDITEQVNKDKVIKQQKEELEAVIENMSDTLYTINKDYNVTYLNSAAREDIYECDSMKKVYNTYKYNEHYDSEGNFLTFKNLPEVRVLKGEKLKDYRYTLHRPDGIYHISFSGSPMYDNSGNVIKAITCTRDITEQVNKDKVIKQQKEELEAIVENMSDGLFIINKEGIFITANKLARDILLIPSENYSIKDVYEEIEFLDDKGNLISYENLLCLKMMRGEKVFAQKLTVKQKDKVIYIEVNATPIYDKEGNFVAGVACVRDITEQVNKNELIKAQKDELIRMQKNELSAIIENMSDGLFTVDKNCKITLLNESAKEFFWNSGVLDVPKDTHTPTKYYDSQGKLLTAETMPSARIFKGESIKSYRMTCDRPDGIYHFNISGSPICDKDGNMEKVLICSRNQTEAVKNIEMIKMQNDQLEAIIENINDYLLVFNKDGNFIKYSKTAGDYIKNHSEIITINDYFTHLEVSDLEGNPLPEENSLVTRIVNGEKILGYKFAANIYNTVFYFELNGNPIYDSKGNFVVGVIMTRDITEEVNYKNKMEETLKIQDEIFANISHELKTPLNVIHSTNQLIELYLKNSSFEANKEKISKSVNVIKQNCYRFSKLINNIVDLSRIDSGFFKLSLVNENIVCVIEDIVESVSEHIKGAGIDIIFDTNTEEKIISCDPEKVERIILNLISNAIKFTNPGGIISIDVIDREDTVEIAIKDTGLGVDKKHINKIFKRFYQADKSFTRNAEGCGIGLSLVKSLVELHDGKISIESIVGEGSVFKIELPSRIIEDDEGDIDKIMPKDNKIEMINIEFSDIYSI